MFLQEATAAVLPTVTFCQRAPWVELPLIVKGHLLPLLEVASWEDGRALDSLDSPDLHGAVGPAGVVDVAGDAASLARIDHEAVVELEDVEHRHLAVVVEELVLDLDVDDLADVLNDELTLSDVLAGLQTEPFLSAAEDLHTPPLTPLYLPVLAGVPRGAVAAPALVIHGKIKARRVLASAILVLVAVAGLGLLTLDLAQQIVVP